MASGHKIDFYLAGIIMRTGKKIKGKKGLENILGPAVIILAVIVIVTMVTLMIEFQKQKYEKIMDIGDMIVATQTELYSLLNFNQCPIISLRNSTCISGGDPDDVEDACEDREKYYVKDPLNISLATWIGISKAQNETGIPIYGTDITEGYNRVLPKLVAYETASKPSNFLDLERCIRIAMQASQVLNDTGRAMKIPSIDMEICTYNKTDFNGTCTQDFWDNCSVALTYDTHVVTYSERFADVLINYKICSE